MLAVIGKIVVEKYDKRISTPKTEAWTVSNTVVDGATQSSKIVGRMPTNFRRHDAEAAAKAAPTRGFEEVHSRRYATAREYFVVDLVVRDTRDLRTINALQATALVIRHNLGNTVDTAGANHVEKLCSKFREYRADAATSHHCRAGAPKIV